MINTSLCYLIKDGKYLMLHRTKKEHDLNKDKWLGVGGHFEEGESPEECVIREVSEETGYILDDVSYRGIITFVYEDSDGNKITELMHLFTSDNFHGNQIECNEGTLEWIPISEVTSLPIWEGDKIFFKLLEGNHPFFSLKLVYNNDELVAVKLNGKEIGK